MHYNFSRLLGWPIAEDYYLRHVFMDLIVLAKENGVVSMTPGAIARKTKRPFKAILRAIHMLESPPPQCRSWREDGAWIIRMPGRRGWVIAILPQYNGVPVGSHNGH
jgi:hypothetical protein